MKLLMFVLMSFIILSVIGYAYTIEGDTVRWENAKGKVSQTPHTLKDLTNYVEVNFTSYYDTPYGLDIAFGFDVPDIKPSKAEYYNPHYVPREESYTCNGEFNFTTYPKHFWCWGVDGNTTEEYLIYEHDFDSGDIPSKTAYWTEYDLVEWTDVSNKFNKINYDFDGKNVWYVVEDVSFDAGETKTLRIRINVLPNTEGKYDIFIKRHVDTFNLAINNNEYVLLDPWWSVDYGYKRKIDLNGYGANVQNYTINFTYGYDDLVAEGKLQADWDDVRFTDAAETTELYYCWENKTASNQTFINIPLLMADNSTYIYMYYDDSGASAGEDCVNTFSKASFVMLGWADATTAYLAKGGVNGTLKNQIHQQEGGVLGNVFDLDGTDDFINFGDNYDPTDNNHWTTTGWLFTGNSGAHNTFVSKTDSSAGRSYSCSMRSSSDQYKIYLGYTAFGSVKSSGNARWVVNQWTYVSCMIDYVADEANFTVNQTYDSGNPQNPAGTVSSTVYDMCIGGAGNGDPATNVLNDFNGLIDDVRIYDSSLSPAWQKLDWLYVMDSTMLTVNAEEAAGAAESAPYWFANSTHYPPIYDPNDKSTFNVSWANNSANAPVNISSVMFRSNFTNETMTLLSGDMWSGVYGYEIVLGAGNYHWWSRAENNASDVNATDVYTFSIPQATTTCTLSLTPSNNETYGTSTTATCSCNNPEVASKLYRGGVDKTATENGTAMLLGAGSYNYICNVSSSQNYTADSDSGTLTINKAANTISMWINGNLNQNATSAYGSLLNITVKQANSLPTTQLEFWKDYLLLNNTTQVKASYTNSSHEAATVIRFQARGTGNANYTATSNITYFATISAVLTVDVKHEITQGDITFNITLQNSTFASTAYDQTIFNANSTNMPYGEVSIIVWAYGYPQRVKYRTIAPGSNESILMYLLPAADGHTTLFSVRDYYNVVIPNANLTFERIVGSEKVVVAEGRTDDSGSSPLFLDGAAVYYLSVKAGGYAEKNKTLIPALSAYTIFMEGGFINKPSYWEFYKTLYTNCTFLNATRILNCTWNDPSGHLSLMTLNVVAFNRTGHEWLHCSNTSTNASGTFYCSFGAMNNQTFIWSMLMDTSSTPSGMLVQSGSWSDLLAPVALGITGLLLAMLMVMFSGFVGVQTSSPILTVILTVVGVAASILIGFLDLGTAAITMLFGLSASAAVLVWKMRGDKA